MSVLVRPDQLRQVTYGVQLISPAQVAPTSTGNLWAVTGGAIHITSLVAVVTTVFTATATTLNIGSTGSGGASATSLLSAGVLTSLAVGAVIVGVPTVGTPVIAQPGGIAWIASAGNTGQLQIYMSYIPVTSISICQ